MTSDQITTIGPCAAQNRTEGRARPDHIRAAGETDLWTSFFPAGASVAALPNWNKPRLLFSNENTRTRWIGSRLYPAFRPAARVYRLFLRFLAASGLQTARTITSDSGLWQLILEHLPESRTASLLVGTPGPGRKLTLECRDGRHRAVGYAKVGVSELSRAQLQQEASLLAAAPAGLAPELLLCREWNGRMVLLTRAVDGRPVPATLPPPPALPAFVRALVSSGTAYDIAHHPWMKRTVDFPEVHAYVSRLAAKTWPVAVQHGDLAAWNLRTASDGRLRAFDWEYGTVSGLPYLDAAHFVLQHQALIARAAPEDGCRKAAEYLRRSIDPSLTEDEADAFARLAVFDAFLNDPSAMEAPLQQWRRRIWRRAA